MKLSLRYRYRQTFVDELPINGGLPHPNIRQVTVVLVGSGGFDQDRCAVSGEFFLQVCFGFAAAGAFNFRRVESAQAELLFGDNVKTQINDGLERVAVNNPGNISSVGVAIFIRAFKGFELSFLKRGQVSLFKIGNPTLRQKTWRRPGAAASKKMLRGSGNWRTQGQAQALR